MKPTRPAVSAALRFRFDDFRIDVVTNSLRLASRLESYFEPYLSADAAAPDVRLRAMLREPVYDVATMRVWSRPAQPDRLPKESYSDRGGVRRILKNRTGVLITLARDGALIEGDLEEHANQVVNLIGTLFGISLLDRGYVMVHGAAVVERASGKALVFLGNSGSGKSSVALQLIERGGYEFLSNDRVLIYVKRDGIRVAGVPKKPRVNPGTLLASAALSKLVSRPRQRAYLNMAPEDLRKLEEKTDVDIERHLGARSLLAADIGRAYSLEWRPHGEGLEAQPLDAGGALDALLATAKDFGPYDPRGPRRVSLPQMRRIAARVPFIGISGKFDPVGLADLIHATGGAE